jgi:hypothetical protein
MSRRTAPATRADVFEPLDDDELDRLDRFLLERITENEWQEGKDEGVFDISMLDGLLTAVVSGPITVPPSRWLPAVWGDFEPVWKSMADAECVLTLLMRHMNSIARGPLVVCLSRKGADQRGVLPEARVYRRGDDAGRFHNRFEYGDMVELSEQQVVAAIESAQELLDDVARAFPRIKP